MSCMIWYVLVWHGVVWYGMYVHIMINMNKSIVTINANSIKYKLQVDASCT